MGLLLPEPALVLAAPVCATDDPQTPGHLHAQAPAQLPRGAKAGLVLAAIREQSGEFRLADIEQACPGVSREWIRSLLTDLKAAGEATCQGKGPAARWRYLGSKGSNSIRCRPGAKWRNTQPKWGNT